jgi:hypothetical protein
MKHRQTIGCFELVDFPEFGVTGAWAKVDTGAYSGAMHCTDLRVVRRGEGRERVLKFAPLGGKLQETTSFISTYVRSATGHRVRRHVIDTTIVIAGTTYPVRIGLSDRSDMKRPVLLGRRFLRENHMIVDVCINQEFDDEGESTK